MPNDPFLSPQVVVSFMALIVVYFNARAGIMNKKVDAVAQFNKQFDEIQKKRTELLILKSQLSARLLKTGGDHARTQAPPPASTPDQPTQEEQKEEAERLKDETRYRVETAMFYDRFWSLQFEQFVAWYQGYVPTGLYLYWTHATWRGCLDPDGDWELGPDESGKPTTIRSSLTMLQYRWLRTTRYVTGQNSYPSRFVSFIQELKDWRGIQADSESLQVHPSLIAPKAAAAAEAEKRVDKLLEKIQRMEESAKKTAHAADKLADTTGSGGHIEDFRLAIKEAADAAKSVSRATARVNVAPPRKPGSPETLDELLLNWGPSKLKRYVWKAFGAY